VPADARELLRFAGDPLALQIRLLDKYSNNFVAEQLTKVLGAELYGAPGTWEKGVRALVAHLDRLGADAPGTVIADGSGLSPRNRMAPATLTALIRSSVSSFGYGPEFLSSLPIGGRDGTLETRMEGAALPVRGKTGHLRRVSSLSGVVPGPDGGLRAFSVVVNGARGSSLDVDAAIDAFVERLAPPSAAPAPGPAR
jgi:D-alanyl-D-alanine carboxypeptidase/D-alanyl-D-alanine-endopeptidase (penicillin-binding protein 4)